MPVCLYVYIFSVIIYRLCVLSIVIRHFIGFLHIHTLVWTYFDLKKIKILRFSFLHSLFVLHAHTFSLFPPKSLKSCWFVPLCPRWCCSWCHFLSRLGGSVVGFLMLRSFLNHRSSGLFPPPRHSDRFRLLSHSSYRRV